MEKAPTASCALNITSDRPAPDESASPTGFSPARRLAAWKRHVLLHLWKHKYHSPAHTTVDRYGSSDKPRSFSDSISSPGVEVVIVRRTAQLKGVVAGRGRLQRTHVARRFTWRSARFGCGSRRCCCSRCCCSRRRCGRRRFRSSGCRRRWRFNRLAHRRFCLRWRFRFWRFCHGLWFRLTLRLNHSLLTLWRGAVCVWRGLVSVAAVCCWALLP